jgi:hypothetical protein
MIILFNFSHFFFYYGLLLNNFTGPPKSWRRPWPSPTSIWIWCHILIIDLSEVKKIMVTGFLRWRFSIDREGVVHMWGSLIIQRTLLSCRGLFCSADWQETKCGLKFRRCDQLYSLYTNHCRLGIGVLISSFSMYYWWNKLIVWKV